MNWAGISEDEFNKKLEKCNSEQERATLITETLNSEYAAAAAEYNELTASTQAANRATERMERTQANLGAAIEPLTTAWTNLKANALEAITPVIETLVTKFQEFNQWLDENPGKATIIKAAIIALATALGVLAAALSIAGIVQMVSAAFAVLGGVMAFVTSPITLIIAGIAALVAAFLYLWNNCDAFREFFINMWENIKTATSTAWEAIKGFFISAWDGIKTAWSACGDFFAGLWDGIKGVFSAVGSWFKGVFSAAWNGIKNIWSAVTGFFSNIWSGIRSAFSAVGSWFSSTFSAAVSAIKSVFGSITSFFSGIWGSIKSVFSDAKSKFLSIGSDIVAGIRTGISNAWGNLKAWFSGLFGDLKAIAKKILGIASPSKYFKWIAEMIVLGLEEGIKENRKHAIEGIQGIGMGMLETMQKYAKKHVNTFSKELKELEKLQEEHNKKDTKNFTDAQKKEYDAEKDALAEKIKLKEEELKIWEDKDKALTNYAKTFKGQLDKLTQIEETYASDVLKVQEKLQSDIDKEWDNYQKTFDSRVAAIKNELGLFDVAEKGDKVNKKDLFKALDSQLDVLSDYDTALETLMSKNVDSAFIEEMKTMGIDALPALEAINAMTDDELEKYVAKWQEKNALATDVATDELSSLKTETEDNIKALEEQAEKDLTSLRTTYRKNWVALASEIGQGMQDATDTGLTELGKQISSFADTGAAMMDGLIEGMESRESAVIDELVNNVLGALNMAKQAADIHSPSKKTRDEIGKPLADGLIVGFHEKLRAIKKAMAEDMQSITASVSATVGLENARYGYNAGVADTGMLDLTRAVGMQTAGINSLAGQFNRGAQNMRPVIIELNGRELGRSYVDLGGAETVRIGGKIGGTY